MATAIKHICAYGLVSAVGGCAIGALLGTLGVIPQGKSPFSLVLVTGPLGLVLGVVVGVWKSLEGHAALIARSTPRATATVTLLTPMSGPSITILRIVLVMMTTVYVLAGLAGGVFSLLAGMLFDAPGSTHRPELWVAWLSIAALPALCFFAIRWAWAYYDVQQVQRAYLSLCLPLTSLVGIGLSILIAVMAHR